jgi:hypothetical protein
MALQVELTLSGRCQVAKTINAIKTAKCQHEEVLFFNIKLIGAENESIAW